jgi:MFS-type transporter involved in bile tolerance (Atg22 family)
MPFLAAKIGTGKHLGLVLLAWAVFFLLAAWMLPPLDSRLQPTPLVYWSVLTLTILLALPTVVVVPAYVYRSWLKLPSVPNRTAYGLWVGLESLLLLAVPVGLAFWWLTR